VSSQVLSEYANVALTKLGQPPRVVRRQLEILSTLRVVSLTPELIIRAIEIKDLYGLSFWDASIIAAAESARCERILSEDMNAGQVYCGVKMTNPLTEGQ
jgi:predicted nucleic acid-binding protein